MKRQFTFRICLDRKKQKRGMWELNPRSLLRGRKSASEGDNGALKERKYKPEKVKNEHGTSAITIVGRFNVVARGPARWGKIRVE